MYDLNWVIAAAAAEVEKVGDDFIYKKDERYVLEDGTLGSAICIYYEPDGTPSCIVGRILHNAGIISPYTFDMEGASARRVASDRGDFTDEALKFLDALQDHQDRGVTWGRSLLLGMADAF